jgi:hypothetical protein
VRDNNDVFKMILETASVKKAMAGMVNIKSEKYDGTSFYSEQTRDNA